LLFTTNAPQWQRQNTLKVKVGEKSFPTNGGQKQAGVPLLIFDKADFKTKLIRGDKESCFILIKGNHPSREDTIINICAPNVSLHERNITRHKAQVNPNAIMVGHFNIPLWQIGHPDQKQKKRKLQE
jgi:hypothetical protein